VLGEICARGRRRVLGICDLVLILCNFEGFPKDGALASRYNKEEMRFADIYCHLDALYGYAMVLTNNPNMASRLVQEAYLRARQDLNRPRKGSNTKGWLFVILRNTWLSNLRDHKPDPMTVALDASEIGETPDEHLNNQHTQPAAERTTELMRTAIQQLPLEQREIILLREYEKLPYQEIAGVLGCPLATVMSGLVYARSRLRNLLEHQCANGHRREPLIRSGT
jgi:RNA polymerase sigma-70 factor, ECF subfamily